MPVWEGDDVPMNPWSSEVLDPEDAIDEENTNERNHGCCFNNCDTCGYSYACSGLFNKKEEKE